MRVAILKASWANLKMCDAEWMFFWMDSNTVSSQRALPGRNKQGRTGKVIFLLTRHTSFLHCNWSVEATFFLFFRYFYYGIIIRTGLPFFCSCFDTIKGNENYFMKYLKNNGEHLVNPGVD